MCLAITLEVPAEERDNLAAAVGVASRFGLRIQIEHASKLPWAKHRPVRATISDSAGCACGLLSDHADWDAETWAMRPEVVEQLAKTFEALLTSGTTPFTLEALWSGDRSEREIQISPGQLLGLVRGSGLGTKVRYVVQRDR